MLCPNGLSCQQDDLKDQTPPGSRRIAAVQCLRGRAAPGARAGSSVFIFLLCFQPFLLKVTPGFCCCFSAFGACAV